jgi:glycosyltransferase involved in cell wall biosynthesis
MAGTDRKSVLIIVENLPVPFDRRVWQEAQALRDAGYQVSVICPMMKSHLEPYEMIDDIAVYRHPIYEANTAKGYLREYLGALYHQLRLSLRVRRDRGVDVIQGCSPPDLMFLVGAFHKLLYRTPYIFDHHDLSPELFETKFGKKGFFYKLLLWAERRTFRTASASIATNETFREIAMDRGGMDPGTVFVVKSYPLIERFVRTDPDPVQKARGKTLVGYVGIMGEQDGIDMLVRAMAELKARGRDDLAAVIIGDGTELPGLKALAADLGLTGEEVLFTGYLSGEPLLAHLSAIDIGVIPDPPDDFNTKLSMNKVFEYMMLSLPFVQFDLAQAKSEAKEASMVVEEHSPEALADALVALADDPERRAEMARFGRAEAEKSFLWENEVESLLEAYDVALGARH